LEWHAGCIYGGRLGPLGLAAAQPRSRQGAQVFTYRELERATDGFSEGNVLGRGAYGAVFRGRLGDGTPAAIKRLQLDLRRQGEREFRVEVISQASLVSETAHARPRRSSSMSMCAYVSACVRDACVRRLHLSAYQPDLALASCSST
jgi:hypothetical protein